MVSNLNGSFTMWRSFEIVFLTIGKSTKFNKPVINIDLSHNATRCFNSDTYCPADSTCMTNVVSKSGYGCCRLRYAIDCGDSWHCCPYGTTCHPDCSDKWCACVTWYSLNDSRERFVLEDGSCKMEISVCLTMLGYQWNDSHQKEESLVQKQG